MYTNEVYNLSKQKTLKISLSAFQMKKYPVDKLYADNLKLHHFISNKQKKCVSLL